MSYERIFRRAAILNWSDTWLMGNLVLFEFNSSQVFPSEFLKQHSRLISFDILYFWRGSFGQQKHHVSDETDERTKWRTHKYILFIRNVIINANQFIRTWELSFVIFTFQKILREHAELFISPTTNVAEKLFLKNRIKKFVTCGLDFINISIIKRGHDIHNFKNI